MGLNGNPVPAALVTHSAILAARPGARCALYTHTKADYVVAALERGLLPSTRSPWSAYEGVVLNLAEQRRLRSPTSAATRR
ncbi:class II aldolase/adducin family protein [Streptomyces sviceus]|uniref:class II aldolase/adducin family protein n=1 Tax=Streptomyces sviceus TaxID=285530 RepID=UPI00331D554F